MPELYPLQRQDARTLATRWGMLLLYEPGAGKTATLIEVAKYVAGAGDQVGIVAPRNSLKGEDSWEGALETWWPAKREIYLTHYEALDRPEVRARLKQSKILLVDEAQETSNAYTKIFRNCFDVAAALHRAGRKVLPATGTPIYNTIDELATEFVLSGALPLAEYNNFVWRYSRKVEGAFNFTDAQRIPELRQVLNTYAIRRTLPEMGIRLPPLYPIKWPIFLRRDNASSEYNTAAADFSTWYKQTQGRAAPPLARFTTLRRLLSMAKAPVVVAAIRQQSLAGKNSLIFTEFRDTAEYIHKNLPGSRLMMGGESAGQRVETFNAIRSGPNGRVLVATGGALAAAVNLQALNLVGIVDMPWTPAALDQWFKRTYRNKQTQAVTLIFFLAQNDDSEKHIESVLLRKTDMLIKLGIAPTGNLRQIGF